MNQLGQNDEIMNLMKDNGIEVNRDNYIMAIYPDGNVPEWSAELEATLPESLQEEIK